jgi:hypothetical protein
MKIKIRCLTCLDVFISTVNGNRLIHNQKDDSILEANKKLHCDCGGDKLMFDDYYNAKLIYPKKTLMVLPLEK